MKTTLLLPLLVVSVLMFTSCHKDYQSNPSLPPITQSGADTFGCLIDSKVLIPQYGSDFCLSCSSPLSLSYSPYTTVTSYDQFNLMIEANDENPSGPWRSIYLRVKNANVIEGQTIALKADTAKKGASATYNANYTIPDYKTTQIVSGELTITKLDPVKKFISGTFKFNAVNSNKDTVHVTDGRFDVHYPYP